MIGKLIKLVLFVVLPVFLLLIGVGAYKYAEFSNLLGTSSTESIFLDQYTLQKTQNWTDRFQFFTQESHNQEKRKISGAHDHYLEIQRKEEKYLIEYEYEVDKEIIQGVTQVSQKGDKTEYTGRYFLVKYHNFVEVIYFNLKDSKRKNSYESQVCLQLPIDSSDTAVYHIDDHNNIWIVTLSLNKIVFIQIYSCIENKLIKEYRYALKDNVYISQINRIIKIDHQCMGIQVVTYGLNHILIKACPQDNNISEEIIFKTNNVSYSKHEIKNWRSYTPVSQDQERLQLLKILNFLLDFFNIDYRFEIPPQVTSNPREDISETFHTISMDEKNHYLLTLFQNKTQTGIIALDRYLINSKTPIFHNNPLYDEYSVLDIMRKESKGDKNPIFTHKYIDPKLNQTKTSYYKAAFKTNPNFKIEHIELGEKSLGFWPDKKLEDSDYFAVRTRDGALVIHKTELKGVYGEMPVSFQEIYQRVDEKPLEPSPKLYELHAKQVNLISRPVIRHDKQSANVEKIELINLLSGKPIFTHYISYKEGFRYMSSFLLNNQWWILEYNPQQKTSIAKKYQFYVLSTKPDKVQSLQMTYGDLKSQDHLFREDDLAAVMQQFVNQHKNGYMFLNIYRCIDEYYYIEYTDASAEIYGVARVHFTKLSNRLKRQAHTISDHTLKKLMISQFQVIPSKYDTTPYAIALKNINIFKHLPQLLRQQWKNKVWYSYCQQGGLNFRRLTKLQRYYYYPQVNYAMGNYGCTYNSQHPQNDIIYSINMRNLIINARLNNHSIQDIRKNIIYILYSLFPFYCLCLFFSYFWMRGKEEQPPAENKPEEKKSKKKKKND